jgi:hypothetical protein
VGLALWKDTVNMTFEKDVELHFFEDVDDIVHGGMWPALGKDLEKLP